MIHHEQPTAGVRRAERRRPLPRTAALGLALILVASLAAGCSKDDGGSAPAEPDATTATTLDQAKAQQKAMEAAERVLSTVRLPGATGMFAKTEKSCPMGEFPKVTRTDQSSRPPAEVIAELTDMLEADSWTHEQLPDGRETYIKEPYQVWVEATNFDGGTKAEVEVANAQVTC